MVEGLKKLMEKDRKYLRNSKVIMIALLVSLVFQLIPSHLTWMEVLKFFSGVLAAFAVYITVMTRERILLFRQDILSETSRFLGEAGMMTMKSFVELARKYEEKKSRLEDLVGPDYEDVEGKGDAK